MYSSIGEGTSMTDFRKISQANNYKNTLKIYEDTNIKGHIHLEASFVKNNGIQIRSFYIDPQNIDNIIKSFRKHNFQIINSVDNNVSVINQIESKVHHPEYNNRNMADFSKQAFNNSFNEKFST